MANGAQQPKKKGRGCLWGLLGGAGVVIVVIIIAVASSGGGSGAQSAQGSTTGNSGGGASTAASAASSPAPSASAAKIGDKVRDGKFQFVVTGVSHAKSVGDTSVGMGDTAQGEYQIISLTVTNIGKQSQTLDDSAQYVYDSKGRKFSASSSADIDLAGNNGQNSVWLDSINPGNTVKGKIAFDMPKGDTPAKIELHDSMFSGGVTVLLR